MTWGATMQDFFAFGLPPAACVPESRPITSIDFASGLFEVPMHGFFGGERCRLRATSSGSTLPTGATRLTYYTVATPPGPDFFSLLELTLTDIGSGVLAVMEDPTPWILAILAAVSSYLVASHTASEGPWTTAPGWAPRVAGHLAAPDVATRLRAASPKDDKYLGWLRDRAGAAETFLDKLNRGEPFNDGMGPVDATPLIADDGAVLVELEGRDFLGKDEHWQDRA